MESLLEPTLPVNIQSFYAMLVSVAGVLLGIGFAAMLFILQSGFTSFKYSRRMYVLLYLYFGKQVLLSLAYLTLLPFLVLYLPDSNQVTAFVQFVFCVFFLVNTLDYAREDGYIITLNSHKFVPRQYGPIRRYFRYISNRGALRNAVHLVPPFFVALYPYILSSKNGLTLELSEVAMFYSCLLVLCYTLFKLTMFIPEFFSFTDTELKLTHKLDSDEPKEDDRSYETERSHLKEYLVNHGYYELNPMTPSSFLDGELKIYLFPSKGNLAHFNIYVEINNTTPEQLKEEVAKYGYSFAKVLMNSKSDITQFVLSFHVTISGDKQRNLFFRFDASDIHTLTEQPENGHMAMFNLKNVCIDELFR
ncbi:hypothetical protein NB476_04905 [Vibrio sp. RM-44-3]|uniref:hypothetical protein n=1 Tax=Vibrio TaxID=662 RepID=UPI00104278F3|nr:MULTISPECIES: hypothetical protein [Vibrio]MCR9489453.1 hypothetical protein [Vibrio alginolyticus]MCR9550380.1 hypothetical protein [Vibrio sp. RM-41-2A]MCR9555950.1 hypothetical protein [Vibrio sp. RM-41-2B]MCR9607752.1 hypothetical protein [Vibrio alginolyticus]MCR9611833.1 hypothetical protein [Vibrio alginolyticus]